MSDRFAIYYAPPHDSALWRRAEEWLAQSDVQPISVSARRYGFHATIKAPMALADGTDRAGLEMALANFARTHGPVALGRLAVTPIEGFLALTTTPQPQGLTDFAATVVTAFEPFRAALEPADRARRLKAPLSVGQIELLDAYGYPYVLEQFQFHMTLTDWLEQELPTFFLGRILSVDSGVADRWGYVQAHAVRPLPAIDSLLAATALQHKLSLVTRNIKDFADINVPIINPWQ